MRETAYAKVNLALHVRSREADGYHRLETIFAFAEDGDELEVDEPTHEGALQLQITGRFAATLARSSLPQSGGEGDHRQHADGGGVVDATADLPLHHASHGSPPHELCSQGGT